MNELPAWATEVNHERSPRDEADHLRELLRSPYGPVCGCPLGRSHGEHLGSCAWQLAVTRVYAIERALEAEDTESST